MRNGGRVIARSEQREEIDLGALVEAVLLLLAERTDERSKDPATTKPEQITATAAIPEESAA